LPCVTIFDSNTNNFGSYSYNIPGNDDAFFAIKFYYLLFFRSCLKGLLVNVQEYYLLLYEKIKIFLSLRQVFSISNYFTGNFLTAVIVKLVEKSTSFLNEDYLNAMQRKIGIYNLFINSSFFYDFRFLFKQKGLDQQKGNEVFFKFDQEKKMQRLGKRKYKKFIELTKIPYFIDLNYQVATMGKLFPLFTFIGKILHYNRMDDFYGLGRVFKSKFFMKASNVFRGRNLSSSKVTKHRTLLFNCLRSSKCEDKILSSTLFFSFRFFWYSWYILRFYQYRLNAFYYRVRGRILRNKLRKQKIKKQRKRFMKRSRMPKRIRINPKKFLTFLTRPIVPVSMLGKCLRQITLRGKINSFLLLLYIQRRPMRKAFKKIIGPSR
jgi:hypothetical protein